jgi:hypothetical protein
MTYSAKGFPVDYSFGNYHIGQASTGYYGNESVEKLDLQ